MKTCSTCKHLEPSILEDLRNSGFIDEEKCNPDCDMCEYKNCVDKRCWRIIDAGVTSSIGDKNKCLGSNFYLNIRDPNKFGCILHEELDV